MEDLQQPKASSASSSTSSAALKSSCASGHIWGPSAQRCEGRWH
jgi:hypothetical protein